MKYMFYMSVARFILFMVVSFVVTFVFEVLLIPYLKERIKK